MGAAEAVLAGRREAEALMVDVCVVRRQTGKATDPVTGRVVPVLAPVYSGACKVQQTMAQSNTTVSGDYQFTLQNTRLDVPVSAGPLRVNDTVELTSSALDPQLVGRVYRVVELFHKTFATSQRTRVEEVTG